MFSNFKMALAANFARLANQTVLFYVEIDRDEIWENYLNGFDDPVERQSHNCNCCKSFLRQWGGIVAIIDNEVVSIWDGMDVSEEFQQSLENLQKYIHSLPVTNVFLNGHTDCGTDRNYDGKRDLNWEHFFIKVPPKFIKAESIIPTVLSEVRDNKSVFKRSLEELTDESVETVLELIAQNSVYRGQEFEGMLKSFDKAKKDFAKVPDHLKENFIWITSVELSGAVAKIRNGAMGTLLTNLSEGMEIDIALTKFEKIMAPTNYKRPTAIVTPKMVDQAKEKLSELGMLESLDRRFMNESDLNIDNVLFVDKSSREDDVFSEMKSESQVNPRTLSKVEEIQFEDFAQNVLPTCKSIEILLENRHVSNFVSLITAKNNNAKALFKWPNPESWSYTNGNADSIKERVKAAGGEIDAELRVSLSWNNFDDLDLHVVEPNGNEIYYG